MLNHIIIYILVFVSGASVLAVEILGTRILGPFYGVSLFLWSALITVTLVALSIGYALGGRWADRGARLPRLCYLMIGAGLWLLLIPWLKHPLLNLGESLGLRFAVLVAAFFLFAPPLTLLGMVSPYAIKVRTHSLAEVGRTAGDLYAVSTIGSVVAALLTGFFLIPNIGVNRLILLIGLILLVTALGGLFVQQRSGTKTALGIGIVLLAGIIVAAIPLEQADPEQGVMAVEQSPYAEIRVVDREDKRFLLIDGGTHTIVDPQTWQSYFPYSAVIDLTREFFKQPGDMLLIGLGGGTLVKNFARAGWEVEAVEIDPMVTRVARQYFGLKESEGRIYHTDGRQFLLTRDGQYDIIVMDAFGSSSIPFHLVTREAFGLIAAHLNPGGVFAINLESEAWNSPLVRSLAATLMPHFSEVLALPTHQHPEGLGNMVLMAANRELTLPPRIPQEEIPSREYLTSMDYRRDYAWQQRFVPDTANVPVLSDDLNPVDLWSERINLRARRVLHEYFDEGRSW